jgi:hypothetical protein
LLIGHKDLIEVLKQLKADDEYPLHTNEQSYSKGRKSSRATAGRGTSASRTGRYDCIYSIKGGKLPETLLDMSEWSTSIRDAERHSLTTQVVTNWNARSIIPADCVRTVPEWNDLRLVKDQPYR